MFNNIGHTTDENTSGQQEYNEIVVLAKRVAKVVKGGRRFSFSVLVVVGSNGKVGYGIGKAQEVMDAKRKAIDAAKKSLQKINLRDGRTLHHDIKGKFGAGRVVLRSAPPGTGIIAGGPMRAVFEALNIADIVAKSTGTSNAYNMVGATFDALKKLNTPKNVAERRGHKVASIVAQREDS
jgi:small subunit ribosomal protein S5